jgi:hypothetical protein
VSAQRDETIETQAAERRDPQRDLSVNITDGVAAPIAVRGRVRQFSDTDAVHDNDDGAPERRLR